MDFDNPYSVSYTKEYDMAYVKIKNPHLFVANWTGSTLPGDFKMLSNFIPKQISKDIDLNYIEFLTDQTTYVLLSLLLIFFIVKLFLAGPIRELWILVYACQLVIFTGIYDVYMPVNLILFFEKLRKIVDFHWLNPV